MPLDDVLSRVRARQDARVESLKAFLRIPSVSTDPERRGDVRRAAEWVAEALRGAGVDAVEVQETDGHPVVYGEWLGAGGDAPTVLVYGHYDVQPPEPLEKWTTPPFEPAVRDGRIYARGATDDKGQLLVHVESVAAWLAAEGALPVNVKFLIEGEEEIGSPHLAPFVEAHRERLACDAVLVSDTAMLAPGKPALTTGLRGLVALQIDVEGPGRDLHSGTYGGAVTNPANAMARIVAALHDEKGRVAVPGFYDDVREPTAAERAAWAKLAAEDAELAAELGVPELAGEAGWTALERRTARPTLDVNGVWSGFTGEGAKTIIPSSAHAKVTCRLVADQDPDAVMAAVRRAVEAACPPGVEVSVREMGGSPPVLVDAGAPALQAAAEALEATFGVAPVHVREGGSIPVIATFADVLEAPTVLMGFGLHGENLHAPDEHFHLENLHKGVEASARFWAALGGQAGGR